MINRKILIRLTDAILAAFIITAIAVTGWLDDVEYRISDHFYQKYGVRSSDIVVIGIDKTTLSNLGPMSPNHRKDIAKAIKYLNNNDSNSRPAVIGIDLLFTGVNSDDLDGDKELVETVAQYRNVVIASEADLDEENILADNNDPYAPWDKTWPFIPPFPELAAVADTGHINAPNEVDGITRHDLLYVNVTERGKLYSFARVIYEKYCNYKDIKQQAPPKTVGNGLFYLPFTAKSYSVENNLWDLLEGNVSSEVYRDKIVLIGPYAAGMQDATPTALDRSDLMYGIDIHANAIQAFQEGFFPREVARTPQLIILFILSFILEFLFRNGKMKNMFLIWLTVFFGWLILCKICYHQEIILNVLWVPFSASILFVGAVATNYMIARSEKDQVINTFVKYVDQTILKQLLEGDSESLDLGGKEHDIAVLFVDIRGFTSMSEKLPPSTVVNILNRYLTLTAECIRRYHGTLDKFVGDCTMAFWNAPVKQENSVYLACRAAMDMIEGSKELKKEIMREYGYDISFGIGVHWGSAVVGNIGTSFRMDYTAIGDTVNTAARLEANARGGTILISRAVADQLGNSAEINSLGNSIKLKGKSADFEILELKALK